MSSVLSFMYHGEVNVAQDELNSFLQVAEDLRVKGKFIYKKLSQKYTNIVISMLYLYYIISFSVTLSQVSYTY